MKFVIDLRKSGSVRARLVRDSQAEAMDVANEWSGRCDQNDAVVRQVDKVWFAVYHGGDLDCVVDDRRFDEMKASGLFDENGWEWDLVRDGKLYETLKESVFAFLAGVTA